MFSRFNQIRIDSRNEHFGSSPRSSEGNGGNKEGSAYEDTEGAPDERISMLNREDTTGIAWLCVNKGEKSECRKSEGQDDQTYADR